MAKTLRENILDSGVSLEEADFRVIEEWGKDAERDDALCREYTHNLREVVERIRIEENPPIFQRLVNLYKKIVGPNCIKYLGASHMPCTARAM